jgi:hypothetical protein
MTDWKPGNHGGAIYYDPREELKYWARTALGPMVAVPVATLLAAAEVRVCRASTVLRADAEGSLPPMVIYCRLPEHERGSHSNGYASWDSPPVGSMADTEGTR